MDRVCDSRDRWSLIVVDDGSTDGGAELAGDRPGITELEHS